MQDNRIPTNDKEDEEVPVVLPPVLPPVVDPEVPDTDPSEEDCKTQYCNKKCSSSFVPPCIAAFRANKDPSPWTVEEKLTLDEAYMVPKFQDVSVTKLVPKDTMQQVTVTKEVTVKVPRMIAGMSTMEDMEMRIPLDVFKPTGALVEISTPGVGTDNSIPAYEFQGNSEPADVTIEKVIQEPIYEYEWIEVPMFVNAVVNELTEEEYEIMQLTPEKEKYIDEACMWQLGW